MEETSKNNLPNEILYMIALTNLETFKKMARAIPSVGRCLLVKSYRAGIIRHFTIVTTERNGKITYKLNGKLHREDGPAVIYGSGRQVWYQNGKLHRDDGPAIIYVSRLQEWYQNGKLHRDDGPAYINGDCQEWYQNGKMHRLDGPAIIYGSGRQDWYQNGKLHREDGPAIIKNDGTQEYWIDGIKQKTC
jgi:antitoxin component YwqK of YwqJK toxin-antitoxin module